MDKPFQRHGAGSNAQVGRDFERQVQRYFARQGLDLTPNVAVEIGINGTKSHVFDLGNVTGKVLVECKAHRWTEGDNVPSAKLTVWNEAMLFFHAAPQGLRKILVVSKHYSSRRGETLGQYYVRTNPHLIPADVEVWEFDEAAESAARLR